MSTVIGPGGPTPAVVGTVKVTSLAPRGTGRGNSTLPVSSSLRSTGTGLAMLPCRESAALGVHTGDVGRRHRDECRAQVADPGQQAVQLGLVAHRTAQDGRPVVLVDEGESVKPARPALVEMSAEAQVVGRGGVG